MKNIEARHLAKVEGELMKLLMESQPEIDMSQVPEIV